ncbi:PI-PLC X domain-containing protein 1-like isoform X2 [Harmonia axyridis]|uniref:PI-PLC X domain-containing protein 1-like isoform X2 n=1 Tax=Harmonia axyridis TaxID=115357 RepID=UPI001E275217|nr:PI-PLC X domain-containing protein 1-like isoform X2 [Harmonia axyridis]
MFDPYISIYTTMVISNFTAGINDGAYKCGPLYITVESTGFILLNWDFMLCKLKNHPDTITFYTLDENNQINEETISTKGILRGYHKTEKAFPTPYEKFPMGWNIDDVRQEFGAHCLPYVIESRIMSTIIDRRCMRIYPSWMRHFGELRLGEMIIPGTHNSGAWTGVPPILLDKYVLNQDRDLYEQLVFGQRYFDIRVGILDNEFRITHNLVQTSYFEKELDKIAKFVQKSPREIIILDIHKFNIPVEFSKADHIQVVDLIDKKIGKYIIPKFAIGEHKYGPKLKTLMASNKSIIVAYHEPELVEKHPYFWPAIHRDWGNKIYVEELKNYLISVARSKETGNPMKVVMAEMTPNLRYIALNPTKGLGPLADEGIVLQNMP